MVLSMMLLTYWYNHELQLFQDIEVDVEDRFRKTVKYWSDRLKNSTM